MQPNSLKIIRKYFFLSAIFGLIFIGLWIGFVVYVKNWFWSIALLLLFLLLIKPTILLIANRTILPVLFHQLDAPYFYEITSYKNFIPPVGYRMYAAISIGDYQTVINIASTQMQQKKCSIRVKHLCLCFLARAYFELRDFEKLQVLLEKYDDYKDHYSSKAFFKTSNSIWSYYRCFLKHDYEACKTICNDRNLELRPKALDTNFRKLQNDFYYAVACYSNQDTKSAQNTFESIILDAPKMHIASVSQKYLEAIETHSQIAKFSEIVFEKNYQLFDVSTIKKGQQYRRVTLILLIALSILTVASSVLDHIDQSQQEEYEKDLNRALSRHYEQAEFLEYFDVKNNGQYLDALCIVDTTNGLDLVSIVTYDEGETSDIIVLVENIDTESYYCIKSAVSDFYIGFQIHTTKTNTDEFRYLIEYTHDNTKYWIGIDYIDKTPKT